MAAAATVEDFLSVARKSQQIDNARLDDYLKKGKRLPGEPRKLAAVLVRAGLMTTFQAEQFLLGKHKGFTLGGYRVLERLGSGGTGAVYLAEHQVMRRRVALKVLPTAYADDPAVLERFRREAQAAAVLEHPNIVHVYDFRQEGPLYFIVMEYVEGPSLQQILTRRSPLPIAVACEYARQAALGLHHAHEKGLVHRDVKPANILVDVSGKVKVLDLGLARYDEDGDESTVTRKFNASHVLGTADYLAPEQAMDLHGADGRADIYGLGGTLYALLTGRPPFPTGTIGQKLMWHQTKDPEPVRSVRPEVPEDLSAVVARMLAKEPAQRFASAQEAAEALAPWAAAAGRDALSNRTLAELHLGPRTGPLTAGTSRKLAPQAQAADTWVARAEQDTAPLRAVEKQASALERSNPEANSTAARPGKRALLLVGLAVTAAAGLLAGLCAVLRSGPEAEEEPPARVSAGR
jgi:serine/threonine protein kinase